MTEAGPCGNSDGCRIALYLAPTRPLTDPVLARFAALLDDGVIARAARLPTPGQRADLMVAHALCRLALSRARPAVDPKAWRFAAGPFGKPEVAGGDGPAFSLSHTSGLAAVAVASGPGLAVGVDAEAVASALARPETAALFCSPPELKCLEQLDREARIQAFFTLWTLKESLLKATGRGLSGSPREIELTLDPTAVVRFPDGSGRSWNSWALALDGRFQVALSVGGRGGRPALTAHLVGEGLEPDRELVLADVPHRTA